MASDSYTIDCFAGAGVPGSYAGVPASAGSSAGVPSAGSYGSAASRSPAEAGTPTDWRFRQPGDSVYNERAHFESSETDRLNSAHWMHALPEAPVNDILHTQLPIMRGRSVHEAINNPTIEGLILSHTLAVVGEHGPLLDCWSESDADDQWCIEAEAVWEEWCQHADASGQMDLAACLKNWNVSCWRNGEFIEQLVNEQQRFRTEAAVELRLHGVEPQRLVSPVSSVGNPDIVLGVKRNQYRRPIEYWIVDEFSYYNMAGPGRWIPAGNILHGFDRVQAERGQARGIPWSQSGLPIAGDIRDYDTQVLDAARSAADHAIFVYTEHPDADFVGNVPKSVEYRRRRLNHLAPGWKLGTTQPVQPGAQYKEHRQERMGDLGKAKGVPSMITRLDARDHNYSSARFDYQLLGESAKHVRATLYNPCLLRLANLVFSEAILAGRLRPRPRRIYLQWIWPTLPEIDEKKSADAENTYMGNGTISYTDACARRHGLRARDVVRRRERDARMLARAGLPSVAEATGTSAAAAAGVPASAG